MPNMGIFTNFHSAPEFVVLYKFPPQMNPVFLSKNSISVKLENNESE